LKAVKAMFVVKSMALAAILFVLATTGLTRAQSRSKKTKPDSEEQIRSELAQAKEQMLAAAQAYKDSLGKLLPFYQAEVKQTSDTFEKRKSLFDRGIVSKRELEESQQALTTAQGKLDETNAKVTEADTLIAEAMAVDQPVLPVGEYRATAALIRYNGSAAWSLKDASRVESFYSSKFGCALPISAFGQTPVHDKLGFDHRDAMDVAVQPDSPEGAALMAYLRSQGIPFIAFRHAVPGSATGAHIHIGRPSHRMAPVTAP
jgi:hypothetical protein